MEVMHERVAGLDVHKAMIVACVRIVSEGKIKREGSVAALRRRSGRVDAMG